MRNITFPCGRDGVMQLLPHRDPFLWVDRISVCDPGEYILAELDVRPDLPLFEGHFPGHPVFPGVLIMEALAQAATCCLMAAHDNTVAMGYLAALEKARFREPVLPGDTIELEARILQSNNRFCKAEVKARKGEKLVAEAVQKYFFAAPAQTDDSFDVATENTTAAEASEYTPMVLP